MYPPVSYAHLDVYKRQVQLNAPIQLLYLILSARVIEEAESALQWALRNIARFNVCAITPKKAC